MAEIVFTYQVLMPFVKRDLEIIKKNFETKSIRCPRSYIGFFNAALNLFKEIKNTPLVICWFASYHAFLAVFFAKIFKKKSIIITGGYDTVSIPEIKYGVFYSPLKSRIVKWILENADLLLPFSEYAKHQLLAKVRPRKLKTIYLSCQSEKFKPNAKTIRENLVITVCVVNKDNVARKGLMTFLEAAKELPSTKFAIIGPKFDESAAFLKRIAPANLEFPGYLPENELIEWYQKAKVYCQLSFEEGEGVGGALGEALASGCIPVVSKKAAALKETVGSSGFYVPYGDKFATAKAISKALEFPLDLSRRARKRVLNYNSAKREKELVEVIKKLSFS